MRSPARRLEWGAAFWVCLALLVVQAPGHAAPSAKAPVGAPRPADPDTSVRKRGDEAGLPPLTMPPPMRRAAQKESRNAARKKTPDVQTTGRDWLRTGENEAPGFGLYTYLLFSGRPTNDAARLVDLTVVVAYLQRLDTIENLLHDYRQSQLNVAYLPVTVTRDSLFRANTETKYSVWADSAASENVREARRFAETTLAHYDYERARVVLARVKKGLFAGPYLLTAFEPVQAPLASLKEALLQDLSGVNQSQADDWVQTFMSKAEEPQDWSPSKLRAVAGHIRGLLGTIGFGAERVATSILWIGGGPSPK